MEIATKSRPTSAPAEPPTMTAKVSHSCTLQRLDLVRACGGLVEFPVRAQRDHLALVVDAVGEHALCGDFVPRGSDHDVADVGFLVAALVGLLEVERELARGDRHVIELRDRLLAAVALAFLVEV